MNPIGTAGTGGSTAAVPQRIFLSHTSDLGKPDQAGSFVAAAVAAILRARHAVTDMAYFAARDTSPAAVCVEIVAQSDAWSRGSWSAAAATTANHPRPAGQHLRWPQSGAPVRTAFGLTPVVVPRKQPERDRKSDKGEHHEGRGPRATCRRRDEQLHAHSY
jgi:hypothetical protein